MKLVGYLLKINTWHQ